MKTNRPITDLIASTEPVVSVEFFPPKNEEDGARILGVAKKLKDVFHPDFVSITYGAGGTTQERTLRYAHLLKDEIGFEVMPHLTCVGASREQLIDIIRGFQNDGFCNIMALRGDPPQGAADFVPHPDGLQYASDLVALIRENFSGFCLGCAGYPEKHPEASSREDDLRHLKHKVDQGASFITTQLFFDNADFYRFVENCRKSGITIPIVPGLLPVLSLKQIQRFCAMCGAHLPDELREKLETADASGDPDAVRQVGVQWAYDQIKDLLKNGAPGFHLYILNRAKSALELMQKLRENGIIQGA